MYMLGTLARGEAGNLCVGSTRKVHRPSEATVVAAHTELSEMTAWIPSKAAFEHVLSLELEPETAHKKLATHIQKGRIPCRDGNANVMARAVWANVRNHRLFDFQKGEVMIIGGPYPYPPPPPPPRPARQSQELILTGLELSATHLHEIWPPLFTHAGAAVPALVPKPAVRKGAGGERATGIGKHT